jgi:hypothetical protein
LYRKYKTTLTFHITPIRITIIKNTSNNKCWQGWGGNKLSYSIGRSEN